MSLVLRRLFSISLKMFVCAFSSQIGSEFFLSRRVTRIQGWSIPRKRHQPKHQSSVQGVLLVTSTCKKPSGDCIGRGQRPGAGGVLQVGFMIVWTLARECFYGFLDIARSVSRKILIHAYPTYHTYHFTMPLDDSNYLLTKAACNSCLSHCHAREVHSPKRRANIQGCPSANRICQQPSRVRTTAASRGQPWSGCFSCLSGRHALLMIFMASLGTQWFVEDAHKCIPYIHTILTILTYGPISKYGKYGMVSMVSK